MSGQNHSVSQAVEVILSLCMVETHHKFRHPKDRFSLIHRYIFTKDRDGFMPNRQLTSWLGLQPLDNRLSCILTLLLFSSHPFL
jgi:hypothetical protein